MQEDVGAFLIDIEAADRPGREWLRFFWMQDVECEPLQLRLEWAQRLL